MSISTHATAALGEYVPLAQAAAEQSVCTRTIRRWGAEGRLDLVRIGPRLLRVTRESLDRLAQPVPTAGK